MGTILPKAVYENNLNYSYNLLIPASQVVPGLQISASLLDANNAPYNPATPLPVIVDTKMPMTIHAVSVTLAHHVGSVQNITAGFANKVLFVPSATYVNAGTLDERKYESADNTNENDMLIDLGNRATELGITVSSYNVALGVFARDAGDAGFARNGGGGLAFSFDGTFYEGNMQSKPALAEAVATHEIGHSLGLDHAATGVCTSSLGNPDVPAPYLNRHGVINVEGYDLSGNQPALVSPSTIDFMGYCDPPTWTSDQDWSAMAQVQIAAPGGGANQRRRAANTTDSDGASLLLSVGGTISPNLAIEDSRTLRVGAQPSQSAPGPAYIQGLDALGNVLFTSQTFGALGTHHDQTTTAFTVAFPITSAQQAALHALKLFANGSSVTISSKAVGPPIASARSTAAGNVQLSWNAANYPTIIVHKANGDEAVYRASGALDTEDVSTIDQVLSVEFSDGVKSIYEDVPVVSCPTSTCAALPTPTPFATASPSPAPTIQPTSNPSIVPSAPLPSASPIFVPSSIGQWLQTTVMSQDYYLVNGQEDLQPGQPLLTGLPNTVWKAVRINTVIGLTPQTSAWLEVGDTNGTFGTSAASQQWFGHYFAWHGSDGSYGAETAGNEYPTGVHEFHIGPDNGDWQILIDNAAVTNLTEPPLALGVRSDAYLGNYNVTSGTFTNGTSVSGLQYQDANGDYNFWSTTYPENFLYPTASSTFDAGPFAVEFNHA